MAFDIESVQGFQGFGAQSRKVLADTEGFFGWSAGRASNLLINLLPPPRINAIRGPLTVTLAYGSTSQDITYDPNFKLERTLPTDTLITLTTTSPWYVPISQTFTIPANTVQTVSVQLAYPQAYAFVNRKNFL